MSDIVLSVENLWKQYRLGVVGASSLREDVGRWLAKIRGKEDPTLKIGQTNDREHLNGQYVWALQDINFEVKRGEVLGIIGKNGAGKSTLLKILSKVTSPTKGNIKIKGRVSSLLEVGTGFHPELTGRENIFLNGAILGMTKNDIRAKFDEIVDFSGIGKYIDTPVKRYSSGMYVRLAFAVAAHLEPEILIVDEVLAVGDAEFQKKCLGKMKDVSGEGRTVLFVSHNMGSLQNLCSRGILLQKGKLIYQEQVHKVIERYIKNDVLNEEKTFWENPQINPELPADIVSVKILNQENQVTNFIKTNEDFTIEIVFKNHKVGNSLYIGIQLYTMDNIPVLASANWASACLEEDKLAGTALPKGMFKTCSIIPKFFLNEGYYKITALILDERNTAISKIEEAVRVNIIEDGSMKKEYSGNWMGINKLKLHWHTSSCSEQMLT